MSTESVFRIARARAGAVRPVDAKADWTDHAS
jgi:hypothetical protein